MDADPAPAPGPAWRMGTFNIRHGRSGRHRPCVPSRLNRAIAALDVDVLGLQEVDRRTVRSWFHDQAADASLAMGGIDHVFTPVRWMGPRGRYGNALVARGRIDRVEHLALPRLGSSEPRAATVADVHLPGLSLTVAVTHLQNHRGQAEVQLGFLLTHLAMRPGPCLLMGDLNLVTAEARPPVEAAGFTLVDGGHTSPVDGPTKRIDHFCTKDFDGAGITVAAVEEPRSTVSDHRPSIATIRPLDAGHAPRPGAAK